MVVSVQGRAPDRLQEIDIPVLPDDVCHDVWKPMVNVTRQLCAGNRAPLRQPCSGDSGGAMIAKLAHMTYVQLGVVSFSLQNCHESRPEVFTRVSAYMGWIRDNLRT